MIPSRKMKTLLEYGDVLLHPGSENILLIFIYPLLSKVCWVKILGIGPWPSPHHWINIKIKSDNGKFDWFQLIGVPTVECPVDYYKKWRQPLLEAKKSGGFTGNRYESVIVDEHGLLLLQL